MPSSTCVAFLVLINYFNPAELLCDHDSRVLGKEIGATKGECLSRQKVEDKGWSIACSTGVSGRAQYVFLAHLIIMKSPN